MNPITRDKYNLYLMSKKLYSLPKKSSFLFFINYSNIKLKQKLYKSFIESTILFAAWPSLLSQNSDINSSY